MADAAGRAAAPGGPSSSSSSGCRGGRGCGLALGRLVRKLRRQSRMLVCTAGARHAHGHAASSSARCHQYDPLSYARNFDLGTALDGSEGYYSFASRFVLAAAPARRPQ